MADSKPSHGVQWLRGAALVAAFVALTGWFTAPQITHLTSVRLHHDAYFSIWRLSWIAHQLPRAPLRLFDTNIFAPATGTLAYSDAVLLQGLLASPLLWAGVPGAVTYNLLVLTSFVIAGVGMFVLVRDLTGSAPAAFVSGLIFAFAPFRIDHYFHLELLWSGWMPLTMWAWHRAIGSDDRTDGRRRWGLLTGLFLAAQVLSCIYYAVFLATWLGVATVGLIATRRLRLSAPALRHLTLGAVLCAVIAAPYAIPYARNARTVGTRSVHETTSYSAHLSNYLASPSANRLYGATETGNERQLFPGATAIALALFALWPYAASSATPSKRPWRWLYAAGVAFAVDLSLGFNGVSFRLLHAAVPVYQGLRVPARAGMLTLALLAPLAGMGAARLLRVRADAAWGRGSRGGSRVAALICVALCTLVAIEYSNRPLPLTRIPTRRPPLAEWLSHQRPSTIVELPLPRADALPGEEAQYQFLSTFHWQRMVNGYSGTYPPAYFRLLDIMERFPDERAMAVLKARGVSFIIIHPNLYKDADLNALLLRLVARPDVQFIGEMPDGFSVVSVYRLAR